MELQLTQSSGLTFYMYVLRQSCYAIPAYQQKSCVYSFVLRTLPLVRGEILFFFHNIDIAKSLTNTFLL